MGNIIIVRPSRQAVSISEAVQLWRAGNEFDVLYSSAGKGYGTCNNQDFDAGEKIEIRWNYPQSLTDFVVINN